MKKSRPVTKKQFQQIWDKYHDALWKIEQAWDNPRINLDLRADLTEAVLEMVQIEKKIKTLESKYLEG